jgi:hypothetical protein
MGPWGIAALVAVAALTTENGRGYAKRIFKEVLRVGFKAKDSAEELAAKAIEYKDDLVAEIKSESDDHASANHSKKKTKAASHSAE